MEDGERGERAEREKGTKERTQLLGEEITEWVEKNATVSKSRLEVST